MNQIRLQSIRIKVLYLIFLVLTSCNDLGYKIENNIVYYRHWNEGMGFGSERFQISGADAKTFKTLKAKDYAIDKNSAYFKGELIPDSNGQTFQVISDLNYYSKDKNNVYIEECKIISADPTTFKILKFPYSKDNHSIFCGTLPMKVKNIAEFKVLETSSILTIKARTSYFKTENIEYSSLDTLKYPWVIYGNGKGETKNEKFKGFKNSKNYR